ncbi:MAG: PHP domain-containing protein [Verrucomicrobiota bacterium]|jgi:PHP family Zn ribbon phosphoesterase|nr:PHP domain-containing protein [Verrucomicrobiota bacterium]
MKYRCDFHIHSCLSPCASLEMSPSAIVRAALDAGLDAIALTDHNSALNAPALEAVCRREGLSALFGMEITTVEEIHCIALFDSPEAALGLSSDLYDYLPDFQNIPEKLGDQPVVDEEENILELVPRYLGNATRLPFSRLPSLVEEYGGLFWPAHIDRPSNSVLSQLGRLPPGSGPILEISPHHTADMQAAYGRDHTLVSFSDAHFLDNIGESLTEIEVEAFTLPAIRRSLLAGKATPIPFAPKPP